MSRFYVDTSAYFCLLLGQEGSSRLEKELAGGELLSSVLLVLETTRNLVRYSREKVLSSEQLQHLLARTRSDMDRFILRDLTLEICEGLTMPVALTPRSLDLAHLRTALWFHQKRPLTRFVSLDEPQVLAAQELGLPVQ